MLERIFYHIVFFIVGLVLTNTALIPLAFSTQNPDTFSKRLFYPSHTPFSCEDSPIICSFISPRFLLPHKLPKESTPSLKFDKIKLSYEDMESVVREVLTELPELQPEKDLIKLVVETIITESDGGRYYDTASLGGLGLTQFNYKTAKYLLDYLRDNKYHVFKVVNKYRVPELSLRENLIHNVHFGIALCVSYYYHRKGDNLYDSISSMQGRARTWKDVYNTKSGKGTPETYLKRVRNYDPAED